MDFLSHKYRMIFIHFLGKFEQANVPKVLGKVCPIISVQDMDLYWLGLRDYLSLKWDQQIMPSKATYIFLYRRILHHHPRGSEKTNFIMLIHDYSCICFEKLCHSLCHIISEN